jgi:hypothetical protein
MVTRTVKNPDDLALLKPELGRFYPVPGFEGLYEISIDGRIRSLDRRVRSRGGTRIIPGKQLTVQISNGYPAIIARRNCKSVRLAVHRALAQLFIPNPGAKPCINHIDGDKANFALSNLEWCTHRENMRHAFDTGLVSRPASGPGEKSPAARLSWGDVREIRRAVSNGTPRQALAAKYGVCKSNINQIVRGDTWKEQAT